MICIRKKYVIGNWKSYLTLKQSKELATKLKKCTSPNVIVCPSHAALQIVADTLKKSTVSVGSQNCGFELGAYTGEVSADILKELGLKYTLVGHSERRHIFKETEQMVNERVLFALSKGLSVVVCVGESAHEAYDAHEVVKRHVANALEGVSAKDMKKIIIAYEPEWAIGSGKPASPEYVQRVHELIRTRLTSLYSKDVADSTSIIYGGSVTGKNATEYMDQDDIDGLLPGGASTNYTAFMEIVKTLE